LSTPSSVTEAAARPGGAAAAGTGAILLATAPADDGEPAAALAWADTTVLERLLGQLRDLGVDHATVVTRPGWEDPLAERLGDRATVRASPDTAGDLRAVAELARRDGGDMVLLSGEIVTQREALAGLLADPRIATGILTGGGRRSALTFRVRAVRGKVMSAASPYHSVRKPTIGFLGVLKVAAADRAALAFAAERLAALLEPEPDPAWLEELQRKGLQWRVRLATAQARGLVDEGEPEKEGPLEQELEEEEAIPAEEVPLDAEQEGKLRLRFAVAHQDVPSLLLVGLVRGGAHVSTTHLRRLFWSRPFSAAGVERAAGQITGYDEDRVLLDSAVKPSDGFFTTFFVSPYSKYIARWAARRGWTPNAVTAVSLAIGVLAAAAFATGERWGLIAGAVLLQASFTTDCVDGQLARFTRQFSRLGAWLDSTFDRVKEYAIFAGLAIGAAHMGEHAWLLAGAALTLQTVRHTVDFCYSTVQHQVIGAANQPPLEQVRDVERRAVGAAAAPRPLTPRRRLRRGLRSWHRFDERDWVVWVKKVIAFPIGERFAAISLTAALFTPRVTFIVLLAWGGFAAAYQILGRMLRSVA
jgi:phosphatidylglycerophosphate synthase